MFSCAIQPPEKLQDFRLRDGVERAGGLVGNQQPRLVENRHRDQHTLRLSHAELAGIAFQEGRLRGQVHQIEKTQRLLFPLFCFGRVVRAPGFGDLGPDSQHRV